MTHIQGGFTGRAQGLPETGTTQQTNQAQQTSNNRLARRGNANRRRVRFNMPSGAQIKRSLKALPGKIWNSRGGVGSGHAIQGFLGISAFRGAYNRASGNTENTTKFFKTQYRGTTSQFGDRGNTTRTKNQAKWAGHGATTGISLSAFVGFVPSIAGGILGGICGGAVRLFKGERAKTRENMKQIRDTGNPKDPRGNLASAHNKSMARVAGMISKKTNSVQRGLDISHQPPAKTRFNKFAGDNKLPSKDSVRTYQGFMEHLFIKEFSPENQDFLMGMKLLDAHPTKENFDFMLNNFIVQGSGQEINIRYTKRQELLGPEIAENVNGQTKMTDAFYNQLQAAVENGEDSNEFQQLPRWAQSNLVKGKERRGSNELHMADVFHKASDEIIRLASNDSMNRFSGQL